MISLVLILLVGCDGTRITPADTSSVTGNRPAVTATGVPTPAPFPVGSHADTVHGVILPDPYRTLEDTLSPAARGWVAAQGNYASAVLSRGARLDSLAARYAGAFRDAPTLDRVRETPLGLVLTRWLGEKPSMFTMAPGARTERLLRAAEDSLAGSGDLRAFVPSFDGRLLALGSTSGGDAGAAISILDATTGASLADRIPDLLTTTSGTRYEVSWLPRDAAPADAFFYPRLWPRRGSANPAERLARGRQFLHRIGRPQSSDVAVFGFGVSPAVPFEPEDLATRVLAAPGSRWLVGSVFRSRKNGSELYAARRTPGDSIVPAWVPLAALDQRATLPQLHGDTAYVLARGDADRGRIQRRVLGDGPALAGGWETVIPERRGVITAYSVQHDAIYFTERIAGAVLLHARPHGTSDVRPVALPITGTLRIAPRSPTMGGVLVSVESWATPPRWFRVSQAGTKAEQVALADGGRSVVSPTLVSDRLEARSRDGTLVPVSIVYDSAALASGRLDGTAPLLIEAYGGFGQSTDPMFDPYAQVWTRLGGIYAYAHVRGGGELGEAWHLAATREHKQRSVDDLIGAVEALIARRYTGPGRVAVQGISFGAIIAGLAPLQRPELFGAALYDVGGPDEIRAAALDPSAARNIAEIGDVDTAEGIRSLRAASPYHVVPARVALPAMLLHSAKDDYNFGTEMLVAKHVARLQAANAGDRPVVWVRTDGGHRWLSSLSPAWAAQVASFLLWQTGHAQFQPAEPSTRVP